MAASQCAENLRIQTKDIDDDITSNVSNHDDDEVALKRHTDITSNISDDDDIRNVGCNVVVIMSDDDDIASNISNHDDLFLHWQNNCNAREVQTKEDASAAADLCKVCLQSLCDRVVLVP